MQTLLATNFRWGNIMVIDLNNPLNTSTASSRSRAPAAAPAATTKAPATAGDTKAASGNVVLSPEAQRLTRLQDTISQLPDVNSERVAALKQAIAEGKFEINPERIAENMLKHDDLLG